MAEEKLEKLLNELADKTQQTVRPGLAEDIKHQIPYKLTPHKRMDNINIIINFKINKVAAAAMIIITMILAASLIEPNIKQGGIFQDAKMMIRYYLDGKRTDSVDQIAGMAKLYEHLVGKGKDVAYYPGSFDSKDRDMILMQWKVDDNKYKVILINYGKLSVETVNSEQLIELQTRMLERPKK